MNAEMAILIKKLSKLENKVNRIQQRHRIYVSQSQNPIIQDQQSKSKNIEDINKSQDKINNEKYQINNNFQEGIKALE